MREPTYCPVPMPNGSDCWREPHPDSKFGLCAAHWSGVVEDHRRKTTTAGNEDSYRPIQSAACPICGDYAVSREGFPFQCTNEMCFTDRIESSGTLTLADIGAAYWDRMGIAMYYDHRPPVGWVYYLRFGDRVKIGTTIRLRTRLSAIPHDEVLALERGSYDVEKRRHAQFAADLVPGHREWFHPSPRLRTHIDQVRQQMGDPRLILRVHA